jgi:cell division protein FtsW (lipid II flippase)
MNQILVTNIKIWVLTLLLSFVCSLQYYSRFVQDSFNIISKLQIFLLLSFILVSVLFSFNKKHLNAWNNKYAMFIIALLVLNITLFLFSPSKTDMYI